jgi:hypothetical protein
VRRNAGNSLDYQQRALEFSVGDVVTPFGMIQSVSGRVTAVWPAIGMADVEFPNGNKRYPVEDLQRMLDGNAVPPFTNSAPVTEMSEVSNGPSPKAVVKAYMRKNALYWAGTDRQYRMSRPELESGCACCPRCGRDFPLVKTVYKRREGASDRLLGCKNCLFLIKESDIISTPVNKGAGK